MTASRRQTVARGALELAVNFAAPFVVFSLARARIGDVPALMAAAGPPTLWSLFWFARARKVDALSILALASIALSLLGFLGGGGVRFLQLREQLVAGIIGLVFLGSAAIGKPLIHQLARARLRRRSAAELGAFEALQDHPLFRRAMLTMTLAWGVGLVAETALAAALVFTLTIPQYLIVSPILAYGSLALLTAWTFWYSQRRVTATRAAMGGPQTSSS